MRVLLPVLLLGGCAPANDVTNNTVDLNAAADRAQGDIDTYAANTAAPAEGAPPATPAPAEDGADDDAADGGQRASDPRPLTPAVPGQPGGLPDDGTPVSEAPFTPDSAKGAANVVQTYYALLEGRKYAQAWALWDDVPGKPRSAALFARTFTQYREYHANVGAPGRVDAGAGQRYVTVPVQVYARRIDGTPQYQLGSVVLHRAGDIDGATAAQRSWRIRSIDLKPAPAGKPGVEPTPPPPPAIVTARYRCMDGASLAVRFDNARDVARVVRGGKTLPILAGQRPASGIWYASAGYELRGKGDSATFKRPGVPAVACTAIR